MFASRKGNSLFYLKKKWNEDCNVFNAANLEVKIEEDIEDFVIISSQKTSNDKDWIEIQENQLLAVDENINTTIHSLIS